MAKRPIFIPTSGSPGLVKEINLDITWHSGFAPIQKKKNVRALHAAAKMAGYFPVLEVSTKSEEKLGQHLSAFHLKLHSNQLGDVPLESAFQGSKVFERGGPYTDLYYADARQAKRDPRIHQSGKIIGFRFGDTYFSIEPKTAFYDWLYLNAIYTHREWLIRLYKYVGFTDIEFNPNRSINCQARSCALFVSLMKSGSLDAAISSPRSFSALLRNSAYPPQSSDFTVQREIFAS